ncbi:MAG: response regulator [Planctomycetaceae bacterium]
MSKARAKNPITPIRRLLKKSDLTGAQTKLEDIASSSNDAGAESAYRLGSLLVSLLEIVSCFGESEDDANRTAEVVAFVNDSLDTLKDTLEDETGCGSRARETIDLAKQEWGEYLELLPADEAAWSEWPETDSESDDDDFDASGIDLTALLAGLGSTPAPQPVADKPEATPKQTSSEQPSRKRAVKQPAAAPSIPDPPAPEQPEMDSEIVEAYTDDATGCLSSMEQCLLTIESDPTNTESMLQFCRELHTLKGASGSVGLSNLAHYLHQLEDYIEATHKSGGALDVDPVLLGVDAVRDQLTLLTGGSLPEAEPAVLNNPEPVFQQQPQPSRPASPRSDTQTETNYVRVEANRLSKLMDLLAELVSLRNRRDTYVGGLRELHTGVGGCVSRMRTLTEKLSNVTDGADSESENFARSASRHATYRARELAELCSDVAELNRSLREVFDPLGNDNVAVSRLIGEFRRELMDLQRVPVAGLFRRLHRPTRDAARQEDKQVEVEFVGSDVRLERSLQERLFEPLLHIVRNAVSHGIESPSERTQSGKDAAGRVTLTAHSNATSLVFEVRDDGRGMDYERLEQKGRERGLIATGDSPSRDRLARLIFHPGFSTRSEVSEVSGRGVGMDVVATQVHRMRGRVEIDSKTGDGTCFRIQIPLRSAIEHSMVMRCGGQLFAVPMQFVQAARPEPEDLPESINTVRLGDLLHLENVAQGKGQLVVLGHHANGTATAGNSVAIEVDSVVGAEEVVVRALPLLLGSHPLLSGLTLSGHGETVQILDVHRLMQMVENAETATTFKPREHREEAGKSRLRILVVDDSLSTRRTHVRLVQQAGFESVEAADGLEALNLLKTNSFDAVLTDLEMPRLGGFELVSEIKQRSRIADIPVIVITSRGDEETHRRLLSLGANQVVVKPLTNAVLAELENTLTTAAQTVTA